MSKSTVRILQDARALIEDGFAKDSFSEYKDGAVFYCSDGALCEASEVFSDNSGDFPDTFDLDEARRCLALAIDPEQRALDADCAIIRTFNDAKKRTKGEVVEKFEEAIAIAKAEAAKAKRAKAKKKAAKKTKKTAKKKSKKQQ